MAPDSISVAFRPHVQLHYRILSQLDLGDDAANLYRSQMRPSRWADELFEAYRDAPGRLVLQVLPLMVESFDEEIRQLRRGKLEGFDDPEGRRLAGMFADVLEQEALRGMPEARAVAPPSWLETLAECRDYLWSQLGEECPPVEIVDVPALRFEQWTRGRATTLANRRVVAVSLDAGDAAFIQVLHEEIHPVTDPVVREKFGSGSRDTAVGSEGFELHRQLEKMAVEVGEAVVETRVPEYADTYRRWCERFDKSEEN